MVATVLTVYGIETMLKHPTNMLLFSVATVLTVYGIETSVRTSCKFTKSMLQQYLPFTVLKLVIHETCDLFKFFVATVLTVYGIETCIVQLAGLVPL